MGLYDWAYKSWKTIRTAIKTLLDLNRTFEHLVTRINQGSPLPSREPTNSYWLQDPPFPYLVDIQSKELPSQTDVVIVGSGITGAAIAWSILQISKRKGRDVQITVLEARDTCSGATGRNGGHIKISPHESFEALESKFGVERAVALLKFQLKNLEYLLDFCKSENYVEAECRMVETVDLFLDQKTFENACQTINKMKTLLPEFKVNIYHAKEARNQFSVSDHVVGALSYQAGAMWPYRFVTAVWNTLLKQYPDQIRIEANTPVVSIDDSGSATHPYHVYTDRGLVRCQHVVHATNAYMSHLLPALKNKSTAVRAHMSAQNLGYQVYESLHGRRSWSIVYGKNDYDYMTQRPSANNTGDTMLGGGAFRSKKNGLDQIGVWDDSRTEAFTSAHLAGLLPIIFLPNNKPRQPEGQSRLLQQHWSGIIALTADSLPFVGELDARWCRRGSGRAAQGAAEWIAAGYNGQGMAFAWLCGIALGIRITSSSHEDLAPFPGIPGGRLMEWLPVELSVSHKRYDSIDVLDLADEL